MYAEHENHVHCIFPVYTVLLTKLSYMISCMWESPSGCLFKLCCNSKFNAPHYTVFFRVCDRGAKLVWLNNCKLIECFWIWHI